MKFDLKKIDLAKINPMKFIRNLSSVPENQKTNNMDSANPANAEIAKVQKNIYMQAGLALLTMVLTVVILFAMTSAWYTNIAQTSGLMFEVEPWGFSGEVIVDQNELNPIKAGPGDEGIIHLKVLRNSQAESEEEEEEVSVILEEAGASAEVTTDIIDVDVQIQKTGMSEDIRKRIFFYVDSPAVINGEQVEKVYVNAKENYTYTLFGGSDLVISEDFSNVPELKWEWVYDVLGYYVYGTGNEVDEKLIVTASEYLRPIEYDLDKATFGEDFELLTVDGETTPAEFLNSVFESDGYTLSEGETGTAFNVENEIAETGVYYPVKVDENGVGIYAYLCTYAQIVKETETDTNLGNLAYEAAQTDSTLSDEDKARIRFPAEISVTAQEREIVPVEVSGYDELLEAIESGSGEVSVQLSENITLDNYIKLVDGANVMVDLNGHTMTGSNYIAYAKDGASLTVTNGTLASSTSDKAIGIYVAGSNVNLINVDMDGFKQGVVINDTLGKALDSTVRLVDCNITNATDYAMLVVGNDSSEDTKTKVIVENSTLTSKKVAIIGNGSVGNWGTEIVVIDSTVRGDSAAVYQPQHCSSITIYNSTFTGNTCLAIKGGSIRILGGSVINGTGAKGEPAFSNSGFADTGDALYIETNYNNDIYVEIENSDLNSANSEAIQIFNSEENVKISIVSGKFTTEIQENWVAEGSELSSDQKSVSVKGSEE